MKKLLSFDTFIATFCIQLIIIINATTTYSVSKSAIQSGSQERLMTPMNGTYTIGSGGNFSSISSAVTSLVTNGVNGPTSFNIMSGVYSESVVIDSIPGSSQQNNIVFKSQTGNLSNVTWYSVDTFAVMILNADFVSFKDLTISMVNSSQYFMDIVGYVENITISDCFISGGCVRGFNMQTNSLEIRNNYFSSNVGFEVEDFIHLSDNITRSINTKVLSNTFEYSKYGAYLKNQDFLLFSNNTLSTFLGMLANSCNGKMLITKNKILSNGAAMAIESCEGDSSLIANNMISGSPTGFHLNSSSGIRIVHNTIWASLAVHRYGINQNIFFCNNLIGGAWAYLGVDFASNGNISDYNNLYTDHEYVAMHLDLHLDLDSLRSFTNTEFHSVKRPVTFNSVYDDLHLFGQSLTDDSLRGIPIAYVSDDIDGNPRSPSRPFMGADEPLIPFRPVLKLKILPEGIYYPLFNQLSSKDSVKIYICASVQPFEILDSSYGVIDSLTFESIVSFPRLLTGGRYYVVVKHFNTLETWSKQGGVLFHESDTSYYDFTSSASQAYGGNLNLKGGKYCIISGDVFQDGFIDGSDLLIIDNDAYTFASGRFLPSDVNGDGFTDAMDMQITDNNRSRQIIRP